MSDDESANPYQLTLRLSPAEDSVRRWLDANTDRLKLQPLDDIYWTLWREAPGSTLLTDVSLQMWVARWAIDKGVPLMPLRQPVPPVQYWKNPPTTSYTSPLLGLPPSPNGYDLNLPPYLKYNPGLLPYPPADSNLVPAPTPPPAPTAGNSDFIEFFKKLAEIDTTITLREDAHNHVTLSAKGLSASFKKGPRSMTFDVKPGGAESKAGYGPASVKSGVEWGGKMYLGMDYSNASLKGEIDKDNWKIELGFKIGPDQPNLSELGTIFRGAVYSMGRITTAAGEFQSLRDAEKLKKAAEPHIDPLKKAADAVEKVFKVKPNQISLSITLGLTGPVSGRTGPDTKAPPTPVGPTFGGLLTVTW